MTPSSKGEVTGLLAAWAGGDGAALERLVPLIHGELQRMARRYMRAENPGHTLQTQALVNEAYLKLAGSNEVGWQNRAHFFAVSARIMRRILVDAARALTADKRGGDVVKVDLNESIDGMPERGRQLVALDEALDALARFDPRKAEVVEMKFFGGLSVEEIAEVLKMSPRSVMRDWNLARAWLARELAAS
jgi:RNA polymerase sigma factor (TIGR02999 family)